MTTPTRKRQRPRPTMLSQRAGTPRRTCGFSPPHTHRARGSGGQTCAHNGHTCSNAWLVAAAQSCTRDSSFPLSLLKMNKRSLCLELGKGHQLPRPYWLQLLPMESNQSLQPAHKHTLHQLLHVNEIVPPIKCDEVS